MSSTDAPRELASGKLVVDEPSDGVTRVRLDNEARRGALDHELLDGLAELVGDLDARCLLLTGTGRVFSAGYDIGGFDDSEFADRAEQLVAHPFHAAIEALDAFPHPTLAALNGHAIGGGLELALTCDMRIASSAAKMGMPPAKLGLIYGHTGLRRFIDVCGLANTNELFLLGQNVDARRGERMGLVNRVAEPDELEAEALALAAELAAGAPLAQAGNKRMIRTLRAEGWPLPAETERELVELRESCFTSDDFREGVRAFAEKRAPRWTGR